MKKTITKGLILVIVSSMVLMALISLYFQVKTAQDTAVANSILRIAQIKQILQDNNEEINKLKDALKEDYFIRAKAAAYIIQNRPEIIFDQQQLEKIAALLQIDEFHIFSKEGLLYAGTQPRYFKFTFESGEQMRYFLPMLQDTTLQLCQDITPNTAESKLMQYAAVWQENKERIIQIGMEPVRLLAAMKRNELSHIFSLVTVDQNNSLFAADAASGEILGATTPYLTGKILSPSSIARAHAAQGAPVQLRDVMMDGLKAHCVVARAGEVIIGVSIPYHTIYQGIPANMILLVLSLIILSIAVVVFSLSMLDHYIIKGMQRVNQDLEAIEAGNLDYRVAVNHLPEFRELSESINQMVGSLLENIVKLSLIFQNVNIPIAVYEYNMDMTRVLATSKIGAILGIPEVDMKKLLEDPSLFKLQLQQLCQNTALEEEDIYLIEEDQLRYVKIRSYQENRKTLGILVDVTEEMLEKQQIRYERDVDLLTDLYTRRAFFAHMEQLFQQADTLQTKAILMIDVDNLKLTNDTYGHEYGDRLLEQVSCILKRCQAPCQLTARLSGDEFVMFLHHLDSETQLDQIIELLHQDMKRTTLALPDQSIAPVCFSCGYTVLPLGDCDYQAALKAADSTMYLAKKRQKGSFLKYTPPEAPLA